MDLPNLHKDLLTQEMNNAQAKIDEAKKAITNMAPTLAAKQSSADNVMIAYSYVNDKRVAPYEVERSWLDSYTYTQVTQQHLDDSAQRKTGNLFFPDGWSSSNAKVVDISNGNPSSTNSSAESPTIVSLTSTINLLKNGQSSAQASTQLANDYSPGSAFIIVENSVAPGLLLLVSGAGSSAIVNPTSVVPDGLNYKVFITEIVPPVSTVFATLSTVSANFSGYSNAQRQSLIGPNQNVLTGLTNQITAKVNTWNTALTNQLAQLAINIDNDVQVGSAKTDATAAQSTVAAWIALSNTGVNGKFTDTNLNTLQTKISSRTTKISSRTTEITTALGSVSQDSSGAYSGTGLYKTRAQCINFLINGANGALYEKYGMNTAMDLFSSKASNELEKASLFKSLFNL